MAPNNANWASDYNASGNTMIGNALTSLYTYDQLNRLVAATSTQALDILSDWTPTGALPTNLFRSAYAYDANGNIMSAERYDMAGNKYDQFTYGYHVVDMDPTAGVIDKRVRNRLYHLQDMADQADQYANDVSDIKYQPTLITDRYNANQTVATLNNYGYDPLGNLIRDNREKIANITWSVAGKVLQVDHTPGQGLKNLKFGYGAHGHRISKSVFEDGNPALAQRTWYIHDAQGNVMANYLYQPALGSFALIERPLYGSDRLGLDKRTLETFGEPSIAFDPRNQQPAATKEADLLYELKDHLGNVTTVVNGQLIGMGTDGNGGFAFRIPSVREWHGYEPFGSLLPGRNYSSSSYRFGFQGQEKDDEVHGSTGTTLAFEYRMHDPRVGRFLSIDPLSAKYAYNSPYAFSENRVIDGIDLEGREWTSFMSYNVSTGQFTLNEEVKLQLVDHTEVLNRSEMQTFMMTMDASLSETFSQFDEHRGTTYVTTTNLSFVDDSGPYANFHPMSEVSSTMTMYMHDGNGLVPRGQTREIGNTQNNEFNLKVGLRYAGELVQQVGFGYASRTEGHELGHGFGLYHPWEEVAPLNGIKESYDAGGGRTNLMLWTGSKESNGGDNRFGFGIELENDQRFLGSGLIRSQQAMPAHEVEGEPDSEGSFIPR